MSKMLTNYIKSQIIRNAQIKNGVVARNEALIDRRAALAEAVRVHGWGGDEAFEKIEKIKAKLEKTIKELPADVGVSSIIIGCKDSSINVGFGGLVTILHFNGLTFHSHDHFIYRRKFNSNRVMLAACHHLSKEFTLIEQEQTAVKDLLDQIKATVAGSLSNYRSMKQLLEGWPEVVELLPPEVSNTTITVVNDELNKLIGLPSDANLQS